MKRILLINGPNLNMLGLRETDIYGLVSLAEIEKEIVAHGRECGLEIVPFQSNHEGAIIDFIQGEYLRAEGIIINPGALAHYGYSLRDCLTGIGLPVVELHISNIQKREEWRKKTILGEVCVGFIGGLGIRGYYLALDYFKDS